MGDGCHEEHRMTCVGCPKSASCERDAISNELIASLKLKEFYPREYRKMFLKDKRKRKSAARLKVRR